MPSPSNFEQLCRQLREASDMAHRQQQRGTRGVYYGSMWTTSSVNTFIDPYELFRESKQDKLARLQKEQLDELKTFTKFVETGQIPMRDVHAVGNDTQFVLYGYNHNNSRLLMFLQDGTIKANKARVEHILKPLRKFAKREGYKLELTKNHFEASIEGAKYVVYKHFKGIGEIDDSELFKDKVKPVPLRIAPRPLESESVCCSDYCSDCEECPCRCEEDWY